MGSALLIGTSAWSFYRSVGLAKMILRYESVLALVKRLNSDDTGSKCLRTSHFVDSALHKAIREELPTLIRTTSNFVKKSVKIAFFHMSKFWTSRKTFLGKLRAVFVDYCIDYASKFILLLNRCMSHKRNTSLTWLQIFFNGTNLCN